MKRAVGRWSAGLFLGLSAAGCARGTNEEQARQHLRAANTALFSLRVSDSDRELDAAERLAPGLAEVYAVRGSLGLRRGQFEPALKSLRRACELRPSYLSARNDLATALLGTGRPREAADALREALKSAPQNAALLNNYGVALRAAGDSKGADEAFRRALGVDMRHLQANSNHAFALFEAGKYREAIAAWQAALELDDGYAEARAGLSLGLMARGKPKEAVQALARACLQDSHYADPGSLAKRRYWTPRAVAMMQTVLSKVPANARSSLYHSPGRIRLSGPLVPLEDPVLAEARR